MWIEGDWLVRQLTSWNPLFGKIKTIQEWKGKTLMTAEHKFGQNSWLSTITRGFQKAQIEAELCVSVWIIFCYSVSTAPATLLKSCQECLPVPEY